MLLEIKKFAAKMPGLRYVKIQRDVIRDNKHRGKTIQEKIEIARKKGIQSKNGLPRQIAFEVISRCILDCEFCILRDIQSWKYRRKSRMSFEEFKKIIDDISYFTTDIQFSGGEPLINKDIFRMFDYARQNCISTLLATNANLLIYRDNIQKVIDHPPDEILISYETLEEESYKEIRKKGNFDALNEGIKKLVALKQDTKSFYPIITLQMVLTKKNMKYESVYWETVKKLGADRASIKALGVWPEGNPSYDKKMVEEYIVTRSMHSISRHEIDEDGNIVFFRRPGECPGIQHAYIGSGGELIPCWYIIAKTEVMGNVIDQNFVDIWNSEKYKNYRYKMLNDWANPLCHRCIGAASTSQKKNF